MLVACTAGASLSTAAHKHKAVQKLIQEEYSQNGLIDSESHPPVAYCQCRITQTTWQERKYKSRIIFSLNKSKYQLCLQTSIAPMILPTIIGWKESSIVTWSLTSCWLTESLSRGAPLLPAGCSSVRSCAGDNPCSSLGFGGLLFLSLLTQCHPFNLSKMQTNRLFLLHKIYTS